MFYYIMDEKQDFRNLLGRDLLAGFNYQFNNDDEVFSINRTKIFKPRYRFLPNQEIHEVIMSDKTEYRGDMMNENQSAAKFFENVAQIIENARSFVGRTADLTMCMQCMRSCSKKPTND